MVTSAQQEVALAKKHKTGKEFWARGTRYHGQVVVGAQCWFRHNKVSLRAGYDFYMVKIDRSGMVTKRQRCFLKPVVSDSCWLRELPELVDAQEGTTGGLVLWSGKVTALGTFGSLYTVSSSSDTVSRRPQNTSMAPSPKLLYVTSISPLGSQWTGSGVGLMASGCSKFS